MKSIVSKEGDSGTTFQRKSQQLFLKIEIFLKEVKEQNAFLILQSCILK